MHQCYEPMNYVCPCSLVQHNNTQLLTSELKQVSIFKVNKILNTFPKRALRDIKHNLMFRGMDVVPSLGVVH